MADQDPTSTIKSPEATNPSETGAATASKYADPTNIVSQLSTSITSAANQIKNMFSSVRLNANKPSAEVSKVTPATPTFQGGKDHRVRLKVPASYVSGPNTQGPNEVLKKSQGIIFPYTPSISQTYTASYNSAPIVHSNYAQYFYKNSSISAINLSAKFTVQNEYEAEVYFSVIHLLRSLTKMRWGNDDNAGSPPPVCRLFAYGNSIMNNVPVAISEVRVDLPDNVDYFTSKKQSSAPVMSTVVLTLLPMYSRDEIQKFTVTDWLNNDLNSKGYL